MEDKRIVVFCSPYYKTGGTELLHQLVYKLNELKLIKSLICYVNIDWKIEVNPTPPSFNKYLSNIEGVIEYTDINNNDILIFPETLSEWAINFKENKKCLWWLSVDNFYNSIGFNERHYIKKIAKKILKRHPYNYLNEIFFGNLFEFHLVQSEYAREHLIKKGVLGKILHLSDYLGLDYNLINFHTELRKPQILYNPLKAAEATQKLINKTDFEWLKLEKLSNQQLVEKYKQSKIYIDFGNHPGKDRIPREAAIFGCVIVTNKKGSANNQVDIPIDEYYKLDENDTTLVIQRLREILDNYETHYQKQFSYRKNILKEEEIFGLQIENLVKNLL
jgi:hypothetical protein